MVILDLEVRDPCQSKKIRNSSSTGKRQLPPLQWFDADDEENDVVVAEEVSTSVRCCLPSGCGRIRDSIILSDPGDAIKVVCNNEACTAGKWMHSECFQQWEEHVLAYLRSSGRARSWSEKQRLQNLWTKKGYDLAFKACDCKCGKGHLKKDLDYLPLPKKLDEKKSKKQKNRKLVKFKKCLIISIEILIIIFAEEELA